MVTAEHCPHCDFALPRDETRCPGCRRRIPRRVVAIAPPLLTAPDGTHQYRSLAGPALLARALLTGAGVAASAVAGTFLALFVLSLDAVERELGTRSLAGVVEASRFASVCCLVLSGIAVVALAAWATVAHGNLRSLGIVDHRFWADRRDGVHRATALWLGLPALVVVADALDGARVALPRSDARLPGCGDRGHGARDDSCRRARGRRHHDRRARATRRDDGSEPTAHDRRARCHRQPLGLALHASPASAASARRSASGRAPVWLITSAAASEPSRAHRSRS